MMNKTKIISVLFFIFLINYSIVDAKQYETLHRLKPGDVVSADIFNETFDVIELSLLQQTTADLVGRYGCKHYMTPGPDFGGFTYSCDSSDGITREFTGGDMIKYLTMDADNLLGYRLDELEIFDDGDGTFSYQTKNYNSFVTVPSACPNTPSMRKPIFLNGNMAILEAENSGTPMAVKYFIIKNSPTRFTFVYTGDTNQYIHQAVCDNLDSPPEGPVNLTLNMTGSLVTLTWNDMSDDETGFKIIRRDTLQGTWQEIQTVGPGITTFEESLTEKGNYWYRVIAINANGDSYGSNVVKITIK